MKRYLLSVVQPDGPPPPPDDLAAIMRNVDAIQKEMKAARVWVFVGGLEPPASATVVRVTEGETLTTDGPYIESKEVLGGFTVIEASDRAAAIEWARKAAQATTLPIEVRAFK